VVEINSAAFRAMGIKLEIIKKVQGCRALAKVTNMFDNSTNQTHFMWFFPFGNPKYDDMIENIEKGRPVNIQCVQYSGFEWLYLPKP
jgi:hypothetical protein